MQSQIMEDTMITAVEIRREIENIKSQVESTVKKQLDLFYDETLFPYQQQLAIYPVRIKELELEIRTLMEELQKTRHYNELLNEKIHSLQEEIDSYRKVSQVIKVERKNAELQAKLIELETLNAKLKQENAELLKTNAQLNHKIECVMMEQQPHPSSTSTNLITPSAPSQELYLYKLFFDGICRGNPGIAACGYYGIQICAGHKTRPLFQKGHFLGNNQNTSNAEYNGLYLVLNHFMEHVEIHTLQPSEVDICCSNSLLIQQLNGLRRVNQEQLLKLKYKCDEILRALRQRGWEITFHSVIKEKNVEAIMESVQALDEYLESIKTNEEMEETSPVPHVFLDKLAEEQIKQNPHRQTIDLTPSTPSPLPEEQDPPITTVMQQQVIPDEQDTIVTQQQVIPEEQDTPVTQQQVIPVEQDTMVTKQQVLPEEQDTQQQVLSPIGTEAENTETSVNEKVIVAVTVEENPHPNSPPPAAVLPEPEPMKVIVKEEKEEEPPANEPLLPPPPPVIQKVEVEKKKYKMAKIRGTDYIISSDDGTIYDILIDENGSKKPGNVVGQRVGDKSFKFFNK